MSRQAWMMSPCRSTLQPYQKVTASVTGELMSGPVLALFVRELQRGERAHAVEVIRVFLVLDLLRQPAAAECGHARNAHHHPRIDAVRAGRHAHAAAGTHRD